MTPPDQSVPDVPPGTWIEVTRPAPRRQSQMHALVLQSVGLPHALVGTPAGFVLVVRAEHARAARDELERYERENQGWPPRERAVVPISQGIHAAIVFGGLLVLAYQMQRGPLGDEFLAHGRADAAAIRAGEWWRAVTALTLHADLPHLAGNVVFGGAFGIVLAHSIGVGLTWWAFLLTGGLGNLLNAWFQDPTHRSIGASTGVFGLLGVQVAFEWMRRHDLRYRGWRRWAPVVMGVGLLAWLGTGGASIEAPQHVAETLQRVDVLAHAWGFAVGTVAGVALSRVRGSLRFATRTQALVTTGAALAVFVAWIFATRSGA